MAAKLVEIRGPSGAVTGGAWLSSARVVRCWVKSRNERNPRSMLPAVWPGTHRRLPGSTRRKVGMTSSHHAPYVQGFTHATMAGTKGCDAVRWSESQKAGLSSDRGLQLDPVKSESLVIADQQRCGEYVPGPCTHRPSRHESRQHPKPMAQPCLRGEWSKVGLAIGTKS
jgi:hypothetical protein